MEILKEGNPEKINQVKSLEEKNNNKIAHIQCLACEAQYSIDYKEYKGCGFLVKCEFCGRYIPVLNDKFKDPE